MNAPYRTESIPNTFRRSKSVVSGFGDKSTPKQQISEIKTDSERRFIYNLDSIKFDSLLNIINFKIDRFEIIKSIIDRRAEINWFDDSEDSDGRKEDSIRRNGSDTLFAVSIQQSIGREFEAHRVP